MARFLSQLDTITGIDTAVDLIRMEQGNVPKKITIDALATALATTGTFFSSTDSNIQSAGSMRFDDNIELRFGTDADYKIEFNGVALHLQEGANTIFKATPAGTTEVRAATRVEAYDNSIKRIGTAVSGDFDVFADTSTTTEQNRLTFREQDGTLKGYLGYTTNDTLRIKNEYNSGAVAIQGLDSVAGLRTGISFDPDAITELRGHTIVNITTGDAGEIGFQALENSESRMYHDGDKRLAALVDGTVDIHADGTGNLVNRIRFLESTGGLKAVVGFDTASDVLTIANEIAGGNLVLTAEDVGAVQRTGLIIDPDAITELRGDTEVRITDVTGDIFLQTFTAGRTALFYDGIEELRSQNSDTDDRITGAAVRYRGSSTFYNVGLSVMPKADLTGTTTVVATHWHKTLINNHGTGGTNVALTLNSDSSVPVDAVFWALAKNGPMTISGSATYRLFDGLGTPKTGTITIARGGWVTVQKHTDGDFFVVGVGATS